MNKTTVIVPREVRYISDWGNFTDYLTLPCILDKKVTGCGFTEWAIKCDIPIILCSPRRILLENKESQHPDEVFYFRNEYEKELRVDKNLMRVEKDKSNKDIKKLITSKEDDVFVQNKLSRLLNLRTDVKNYYELCRVNNKPCKYLVTYDSFRHIKEVLEGLGVIDKFLVIIDEFQSIFTDSRFKSDTEIELLYHLQSISNLMYVSATPMIEEYLDQLDEFKDLPYYELDWVKENPLRIIRPIINPHRLLNYSVQMKITEIIFKYREGKFDEATLSDNSVIKSKEAVFYVNSVKNICDTITKANLTPEECNILCANTEENIEKIKKAFKLKKNDELIIGKVPVRGEQNKMFTFCTRTVYLGADFYSTNAKTYIFSDANIDCMAVDITLDLPQIMGRQRLSENPWKNIADLYYKTSNKECTESFEELINSKKEKSKYILSMYNNPTVDSKEKNALAELCERDTKATGYKHNYIAVSRHGGNNLFPIFNNLVMLSEIRAYEIQHIDYKDRFSLFNALTENTFYFEASNYVISFLKEFDSSNDFYSKMKLLSNSKFTESEFKFLLNQISPFYVNYINKLGLDVIKALGYNITKCDAAIKSIDSKSVIKDFMITNFIVGHKYSKNLTKSTLQSFYNSINILKRAKAQDIGEFFEIRPCKVKSSSGDWENAFEILDLK